MSDLHVLSPEVLYGSGCDLAVVSADLLRADLYEVKECVLGQKDADKGIKQIATSLNHLRSARLVTSQTTVRRFLLHDKRPGGCGVRALVPDLLRISHVALANSQDPEYREPLRLADRRQETCRCGSRHPL